MEKIDIVRDWVHVDATKRAAENWSGSQWVPSKATLIAGTFAVQRTKTITPKTFKEHNHGG
jgi:hypothetical protein